MLDLTDIAIIGIFFAGALLALYVLLRPRRSKLSVGIGREFEEQVESLRAQFGLNSLLFLEGQFSAEYLGVFLSLGLLRRVG